MTLPTGFQSIGVISHRAAIVGRVIDDFSGQPLAGAVVTITSGPEVFLRRLEALRQGRPVARPDQVASDAHGFFVWKDLPAGDYDLSAMLPGSGTRYAASASASRVRVGAPGAPSQVPLRLAPTMLKGEVRSAVASGPVALARVRLEDSGEQTTTAEDGRFVLHALEAGARRLRVTASGHADATEVVMLSQGKVPDALVVTLARRQV